MRHEFTSQSEMPVSASDLFAYHARPGALERLLPPWQGVTVESSDGHIRDGARVVLRLPPKFLPAGLLPLRWVAEHQNYRENQSFQDVQISGPFASWLHTHTVSPAGETRSLLTDHVTYELPAGRAGDFLGARYTQGELERMFDFRHVRTREDLVSQARFAGKPPLRVLVSGAGGLVGSALRAFLTTGGHSVAALTRRRATVEDLVWAPSQGTIEADRMNGFDGVVHLAGESIVGRWTAAKKRQIRDSRVQGTRLLCETLAKLKKPPRALVAASAIGFYGDRGDEIFSETSPAGKGFLAEVCQEWEAACQPARDAGIRVVTVRVGLVLSPGGGVLGTLLPLFRSGLGGKVGSGQQWMSWISRDDLIDILYTALGDDRLSGPVNGTAPNPVTNADFTQTLAKVLHRPALLPVPRFGVKLALGESADELALASARVLPVAMQQIGHAFRHPELEPTLRFLLGATQNRSSRTSD